MFDLELKASYSSVKIRINLIFEYFHLKIEDCETAVILCYIIYIQTIQHLHMLKLIDGVWNLVTRQGLIDPH